MYKDSSKSLVKGQSSNCSFLCTRPNSCVHPPQLVAGRTPLIRAPIGLYAKVCVFKARFEREAAIF